MCGCFGVEFIGFSACATIMFVGAGNLQHLNPGLMEVVQNTRARCSSWFKAQRDMPKSW
jgi:hypothetical protein